MIDDLLKQVEDLLKDGRSGKEPDQSPVRITVGDNCTVIVGDRNRVNRRRKVDKPQTDPGSPGRRDADQELHNQMEQLRYQVRALERLAEHLLLKKDEPAVKRNLGVPRRVSFYLAQNPRMPASLKSKPRQPSAFVTPPAPRQAPPCLASTICHRQIPLTTGISIHVSPYSGYDIRTVQEQLGHKDLKTTQIYTHILERGANAVKSPFSLVVDAKPLGYSQHPRRPKPDDSVKETAMLYRLAS